MPSTVPCAVTLDVGTSSVRVLLFDLDGQERAGFGDHQTYHISTTHDGGAEADPESLFNICASALTCLHTQLQAAGVKPAAVAFDTFWHSVLGTDQAGSPTTPIIHLFDTRATQEARELAARCDGRAVHARTGCRLHTSYWPAKLLWLSRNRAGQFAATARWMSFGEYVFRKLFGDPIASTSMASGSGLWNQAANRYDAEVLGALPIGVDSLYPADRMDCAATSLLEPYRAQWPLFHGIPWYPALGDGACSNIGSGCTKVGEFALMVGTSGALRSVIEADSVDIPDGLWCYRVDRKRFILGGALSNGGDVYAWMKRTLALPAEAEVEAELAQRQPGAHNLMLLPFFAGERSPYWRPDLRAVICGMDLATTPMDILQAALESVSLRFREILTMMAASLGEPQRVIASGGGLLASPAWIQMMADALGQKIYPCVEPEATSRGAALLAFERLGAIPKVTGDGVRLGPPRVPNPQHHDVYAKLLGGQRRLFDKLFT